MITGLSVGGFKAFGDLQTAPLRPLTLVFGPNSGGKSSLLHALILLHEASRTGSIDVRESELAGSALDLGGFHAFVHRRRVDAELRLGLTLESGRADPGARSLLMRFSAQKERQARRSRAKHPRLVGCQYGVLGSPVLELTAGADGALTASRVNTRNFLLASVAAGDVNFAALVKLAEAHGTAPEDTDINEWGSALYARAMPGLVQAVGHLEGRAVATPLSRLGEANRRGLTALLPVGLRLPRDENQKWVDDLPVPEAERAQALALSHQQTERDTQSTNEWHLGSTRFAHLRTVSFLHSKVREANRLLAGNLASLSYLGPLRAYPPRGIRVADPEARSRALGAQSWQVAATNQTVRRAINRWLGDPARLQTPYRLVAREYLSLAEVQRLLGSALEQGQFGSKRALRSALAPGAASAYRLFEVALIDQRYRTEVSHRDVGLGVSQVLPVLVEAYGSTRRTIAIEQPEIHLHPALQAELADVFIESALGKRRNRFILETHSEHLILRILRRVRETTESRLPQGATPIKPEDVAVLFVRPGPRGAVIEELPITPDGEFGRPWPSGFFPDRAKELV